MLVQDECESRTFVGAHLKQQLDAAQQEVAERSAALAAAEDSAATLSQQIGDLRAQNRASGQQVGHSWISCWERRNMLYSPLHVQPTPVCCILMMNMFGVTCLFSMVRIR